MPEPDPIGWEILLGEDGDTAGLVDVPDDELEDYDECVFDLQQLAGMVELAESLGWENVVVNVKEGQPLFLRVEDESVDASIAVAPYFLNDA